MSDTTSAFYVAGAAVAVVAAAVVLLWPHHHASGRVEPVPHAATPAQQARNLEAWLRRYSR